MQLVRLTDNDRGVIAKIESLLDPERFGALSGSALRDILSHELVPLANSVDSLAAAEHIFGIAVGHPNPLVRATLVDFAASWLPYPIAAETLVSLVADPDDVVCLPAIRACGEYEVEYAVPYFASIVGWPSRSLYTPSKPVGLGAAHVQEAFKKILGSAVREEIEESRLFFEEHGKLPDQLLAEFSPLTDAGPLAAAEADFPTMVLVPGGPAVTGLPPERIPDRMFGWSDAVPAREIWLPPFLMDRYPVTNAEYDAFCSAVQSEGHQWCHPEEPEGKDHVRNTFWDERFGADHPATGLDWYDAYAYAHWAGKELPTEFQWEKAARGPAGLTWPWGDEWADDRCTWAGTAFGRAAFSLDDWRGCLARFSPTWPQCVTAPVGLHEDSQSGYGIVDATGNAWEWTKTDAATGRFFTPSLKVAARRMAAVTLKGGAWSSLPGLLFPSYRGRDAPTCRHNEIGLRCVRNTSYRALRRTGHTSRRNTAVY